MIKRSRPATLKNYTPIHLQVFIYIQKTNKACVQIVLTKRTERTFQREYSRVCLLVNPFFHPAGVFCNAVS
jgi:hypothetical protein